MRILHTADWHLGIELHKQSLLEDQANMLQQLLNIVIEEDVDVVIVAGDIYDTALANQEAITLFDEVMTTLCKDMKKQVILIAGNHDSAVRLSSMKHLLHQMGLHVYGRLEAPLTPCIIEDIAIFPVPFFHLETFRQAFSKRVTTSQEAFAYMCQEANTKYSQYHRIMIAHTFCSNATVSHSDRFAHVGGSDMVSASVFDGMDYVALGHLHRMQEVKEHVFYSGSPMAYAFDDARDTQGVLIYDTKTRNIQQRRLTPLHPLVLMKGTYEQILEQLKQKQDPMAYQKIEIIDQGVNYEMMEYFREHLPNLLQLTGKQANQIDEKRMDMNVFDTMSDLDIMKQFFLDYYDEELTPEQIQWIQEAMREQEESVYAT